MHLVRTESQDDNVKIDAKPDLYPLIPTLWDFPAS